MTRKCFYSFHYKPDNWRASTIRNIGAVEGNKPASDNDWETITKSGHAKIKSWIDGQLKGRSCTIVLAGSSTANRKWINYEIEKSWNDGKGVVVIHIHNIKNSQGKQSTKGANPLRYVTDSSTGKKLSSIAKAYDPPRSTSTGTYSYIENNIEDWIEEAIKLRNEHS